MRPNIASASFIISLMLALTLSVVPARQLRGSQQTLDHVKVEGEWSPKQLLEDITTDWPKVVTNLGLVDLGTCNSRDAGWYGDRILWLSRERLSSKRLRLVDA